MKKVLTLLILIFSLSCFSQTQREMNETATEEFSKAEAQLKEVYQKVLSEYSSDPIFTKKFKESQEIWTQLRDAELEMKFPEENKMEYGSFFPVCAMSYLTNLTEKRTEHLRDWLKGTKEGEMCNGSIKQL